MPAVRKRESYNPLLKSYPDSEKVNAVSIAAETLFTRLIAQADDANHYYADAGMVLGKLYTRRMCAGQVSLAQVKQWIDEVVNAGLCVLYQHDGRLYLEILNCKKDLRTDVKPDIRFPERTEANTLTASGRVRPEFVPPTQPNPTQPNPTEPSAPAAAGSVVPGADGLPDGFVRFWAAWPRHHRKQGRAKCVKAWKRMKLEPLIDRVIEALERSKASPDWGRGFIPFPLTWMNNTPWETDPSELVATTVASDASAPDDLALEREMDDEDRRVLEEVRGEA